MKILHIQVIAIISCVFVKPSFGTLGHGAQNQSEEISMLKNVMLRMSSDMMGMEMELKELKKSCVKKDELESQLDSRSRAISQQREFNSSGSPIMNPQYQSRSINITKKEPVIPSFNMSSVEQIIKLLVRSSCYEWKQSGFTESGNYEIDPDGVGSGEPPFLVYCDMVTGFTFIRHDMESLHKASSCTGVGCSVTQISYAATQRQIKALLYTSHSCQQYIKINCFESPLNVDGVNLAWWKGADGARHYEWAGEQSAHTCTCGYTQSCVKPQKSCNCDAKIANVWVSDVGYVTNTRALPITEVAFGSENRSSGVQISYSIGPLRCHGTKDITYPRSCLDLFTKGVRKSGWYLIGEPPAVMLASCDMAFPEKQSMPYDPSSGDAVHHKDPVHINLADLLLHQLQSKDQSISTKDDVLEVEQAQEHLKSQLFHVNFTLKNLAQNLETYQSNVDSHKVVNDQEILGINEDIKDIQNSLKSHNSDMESLTKNISIVSSNGVEKTRKVIFHATKKSGTQSSSNVLIYETVDINIGDGYDKYSGKFTAPYSGIYYMESYVRSESSSGMYIHMYRNSQYIGLARLRSDTHDQSTGIATILNLDAGDTVYVKVSSGSVRGASDGGTSFMGYLLL